jgi:hypothetical protein
LNQTPRCVHCGGLRHEEDARGLRYPWFPYVERVWKPVLEPVLDLVLESVLKLYLDLVLKPVVNLYCDFSWGPGGLLESRAAETGSSFGLLTRLCSPVKHL